MELKIIVQEGKKAKSINDVVKPKTDKIAEKQKKQAQQEAQEKAQAVSNLASYAKNMAKSAIKQTANYFISDIGRRNGDSNYQQLINRKLEVAQDWIGVGMSISSGVTMGMAAGPVGAVVGGVLGAASSGISLGFKYAERERAYQHEMFKENNSQAYNLARANFSAMTGRVR